MDLIHVYEEKLNWALGEPLLGLKELCRLINQQVRDLQRQAFMDMRGEGVRPEEVEFELELEFKVGPEQNVIRMPADTPFLWPDRDGPKILRTLGEQSGTSGPKARLSIIRLRARSSIPHSLPAPLETVRTEPKPVSEREVYAGDGQWRRAAVFRWDNLSNLTRISGTALIESPDTTVYIPEGRTILFDRERSGVIQRESG
jgi:N-methylhydantoinase A/acetophenone carboxylase